MQPEIRDANTTTSPDWEVIVVDFEGTWNRGVIPDIGQFFRAYTGEDVTRLIHELVMIDMETRWRKSSTLTPTNDSLGSTPPLCDYLRLYPELGPIESLPANVIAEEYRVRIVYGDRPTWDQFLVQHVRHVSQLIPLLAKIDRQLAVDSEILPIVAPVIPAEVDSSAPLSYKDYTLQRLIGAGGMGRVYAARHKSDQQIVAVKALRKSLHSDPRAVRQFVQEAHLLGQLAHPHIVQVSGVGRFPHGGYFMVMDYISGENLQTRLNRGPMPVVEAVQLVRIVASAIQHAHELGIIHCDLKPANILIDHAGEPYVTDFGFAQLIGNRLAEKRSIGGTYGYIAPEVLAEGAKRVSAAVDVYGLGALLVALLTGSPPDYDSDYSLASFNRELPTRLVRICERCIEVDPRKRFESIRDFVDALRD